MCWAIAVERKEEEAQVEAKVEIEAEADMEAEEFEDAEEELTQIVEPHVVSEVEDLRVEMDSASKSPSTLPKFLTRTPPSSSAAPDPPSTPPGSHPELPAEPTRSLRVCPSKLYLMCVI